MKLWRGRTDCDLDPHFVSLSCDIFCQDDMKRREFIRISAGATARLSLAQSTEAPRTYTYKTAEGCEIKADVYGAEARTRQPAVNLSHRGAPSIGFRQFP